MRRTQAASLELRIYWVRFGSLHCRLVSCRVEPQEFGSEPKIESGQKSVFVLNHRNQNCLALAPFCVSLAARRFVWIGVVLAAALALQGRAFTAT